MGKGDSLIPLANPRAQYVSYKNEIDEVISRVLDKGRYILGDEVDAFESEFAAYLGTRYGIGVGSGTEALHGALRACGVGEGDEVITVSHTAVATVAAIELCGARPVFIDIERDYFTMDPQKLTDAITPKTKAVIPVHLYGLPADLKAITEIGHKSGIRVIEDCAQAHGALYQGKRVGSWGDMACFSFYPTKNLGAIGDGGIIVTSDPDLAKRGRLLREYGWTGRYVSDIPGWNSRLDEIQAAVLRVKLKHLDSANASRVHLASLYDEGLSGSGLATPKVRPETEHVYHLYVIRSPEREKLQAYLKAHNVGTLIHYPVPVHLQPAYRGRLRCAGDLSETEQAVREVLSLPMYPELSLSDVHRVTEAVGAFENRRPW
jgi:dTDP-4-amino-4,6-dideoxygalactose transaminase